MKNKIFTRHIACITLTMVLVACNSSGNKNISPGEEMLEHLHICTADRLNIREEPSIHAEVLGIRLAGIYVLCWKKAPSAILNGSVGAKWKHLSALTTLKKHQKAQLLLQ